MRTYTNQAATYEETYRQGPSPLLQSVLAIIGGIGLFLIVVFALLISYDSNHTGRIYPGVHVAGVDLSGQGAAEAAALLAERLTYPSTGQVVFQEGANLWMAHPSELGLFLDAQASALAAYQYGRQGDPVRRLTEQLQARNSGVNLPPQLVYDERTAQNYLQGLASQIERPVIEAALTVRGADVVASPGQTGLTVDMDAALDVLENQIRSLMDGVVTLQVIETPPAIMDVSEQEAIARRILSAPLVIAVPDAAPDDPGPWTIDPEALGQMLVIERVAAPDGARYQVGLDVETLRPFLEGLASTLARYPQNARFTFNDETRQLVLMQPGEIGRTLNVDDTIAVINQQVYDGEHNILLDIDYTQPEVPNTATAEQFGITEPVSQHTSYFYGSDNSRIQNITIASARFHGVMVPPGATFSMAEVLGDVSLDNGYAEALIIFGDRTIQGVGGGVCQVSTTLFRTVFMGGFPVVERYPHAYRVGYYEQTPSGGHDPKLAGLDATVFVPVVDFKFINDTPYWLLMETYVNPTARTLTWKFYSTSDGRTVEWQTTGPQNIVEPPDPLYEENPDLAEGQIKQVDYSAHGADVTVNRTVWKDGQTLHSDTFYTHYLPWQAVYQYGPGTDIPTPDSEDDD